MKLTGKPVVNVPINKKGVDYVVGDIHGCYTKLIKKIESINFDFTKDRLFAVGDLVDRGLDSLKCIDLLDEPWFYSVRGNHEQFAIDYSKGEISQYSYIRNGGQWFLELPELDQDWIAEKLDKLPWVIQLKTNNGTIGIVHSQPVKIQGEYNWKRFIKDIKDDEYRRGLSSVRNLCTLERLIAYDENELKGNIKGVLAVVGGHTPAPKAFEQWNYYCIDTGACYNAEPEGYGYFTLLRADTLEFV